MKLVAMLSLVLGAFGILNAVNEWVAASHGVVGGTHALAVALGVFASALLLGAGVAILLRMRQAARVALLASLALVVAARLMFPWMSIFSQLVGIGLPVVLLIALYWPRRPSTLGAGA